MIRLSNGRNKAIMAILAFLFFAFTESSANNPVQLHIDKTVYHAGDVMYIKGYIVDQGLINGGRDFNLALIDVKGQKTLKTIRLKPAQLTSGVAVALDNTLKSSIYQVRVFDEFYSSVYNSTSFLVLNREEEEPSLTNKRNDRLQVFVEGGGTLISGLENTMVIKYLNTNASDGQVYALISDKNDSIISRTKLSESGLAKMQLIPERDNSYSVKIAQNESIKAIEEISDQRNSGIIANTLQSVQGDIIFDLLFVKTSYNGYKLRIFNNDRIVEEYNILENHFRRQFVSSNLPGGIIQFGLFDSAEKLVKSRLVFNRRPENLRLTASTEKTVYKPGETVKLNIRSANRNGSSLPANISISVSDANQVKDLVSYRQNVWTSNFDGLNRVVRNPQNYFDPAKSEEWPLDNLMITLDRRIPVVKGSSASINPKPGINISGRVISGNTNLPPKGVVLTIPGLNGLIRYSQTDANGNFFFNGFDFEGQQDAYLNVWPPNPDNVYQWDVNQPKPDLEGIEASLVGLDNKALDQIIKYNGIRTKVEQQYFPKIEEEPVLDNQRKEEVSSITNVDIVILMDDYVYLPNMKSVVKEVIPYTQIKKYGFKMFSPELRRTFPGKPLVLLDGVPVADSVIMNQDPIIFQKIELINKFKNIYKIGKVAENGIIAFYTRPGHSVEQINTLEVQLQGYYASETQIKEIIQPATGVPYIPATLFWNSDLNTGADGRSYIEFKAPDYEAEVTIHIEGISSRNGFGILEKTIKIAR